MGKKVLVLTGSPRPRGNSIALAEAFIRRAEELGHTVTRFDAAGLTVGGCQGCQRCYQADSACVFDDDFNRIAPALLEADAVVLTMPVYWYSIPAQLKAVIDKFFAFYVGGKPTAGKQCLLIACCGEKELSVFEGVRRPVELTAKLLGWEMAGELLLPGVMNEGDVAETDGCRRAAALAEAL